MNAPNRRPAFVCDEADDSGFIQPCPFSPGYRIAVAAAWRSLLVYECYRLILAGILLWLFYARLNHQVLGTVDARLFQATTAGYLLLVLLNGVTLLRRCPGYALQAQIQIFIDIVAIGLLAHASGGPQSGLSILLTVAMAAGGLLVGGRCALVFAAIASSAVLGEQFFVQHLNNVFDGRGYTNVGLQGAAYFAIAVLAFVAAKRTEQSDALARQRGADLTNLQQLNGHIVQHLQSGIVVVDDQHHVVTANRAALHLLNLGATPASLDVVSPELLEKYRYWLTHPREDYTTLDRVSGNRIQVRFTRFAAASRDYAMIFLEDDALYNQRVQRSKLASLGRLTASIAHEIRNPLSAVNHA
ncbi:MAG: PAS domain-containing protein, partial [Methylococcaceae bacterium]